MRTISACARLLREDDPDTAFTQNAIRTKVLTGEIPHVRCGNKRLINYDTLVEYLQNPLAAMETSAPQGTIRRVG